MPHLTVQNVYNDSQAFRCISHHLQRDPRSVAEIAEVTKVSAPTVRKWMFGEVQYPQLRTLFKFCKAYRLQMRIIPSRRTGKISTIGNIGYNFRRRAA